ncbi:MAG: DUF4180 domain-containing protein [Anaerofustis sp.]
MSIQRYKETSFAIVDQEEPIHSVSDALDVLANARYLMDCTGLMIPKECFSADFFDLQSGLAGEIFQKFINYRMKLAIIGDITEYAERSKSFSDLVTECNRGMNICFAKNNEEARPFFDA